MITVSIVGEQEQLIASGHAILADGRDVQKSIEFIKSKLSEADLEELREFHNFDFIKLTIS